MQQNVTQDFLTFPDQVTLEPGNNLLIYLSSGATGYVVRLTMKWSEDIAITQQGGVPTGVATSIINQGNPAPTPVVLASPTGDPGNAIQINNDGTVTFGDVTNPGSLTLFGALSLAGKHTQIAGSTSGTADIYELITGFTAGGVRNTTGVTTIPASGGSDGHVGSAWDTLEFSATGAVGAAMYIFEGQ